MITLKTNEEIQRLQESADLVSEVHNRLQEIIEPGLPTLELDSAAEKIIRGYGAVPAFKGYRGFPYNICASVNEQVVHGFPSPRKLREGDILSLDIGVFYNGYVGDVARSIGVGELSEENDKLLRRAYAALREGVNAARVGSRVGDISHTVERYGRRFGYGIVKEYVGHGVGREMHEDPQIPNVGKPNSGQRLRAGLVICIEPMFNLGVDAVEVLKDRWTVVTKDRKVSVHVEDMVAVFPDGPRVLSSANGRIYPEDEDEEIELREAEQMAAGRARH